MKKRGAAGQVIVESAIAVTTFLVLMFGVLDFGRAFFTWQTLSTVAHEGARWAIVHGADSGMTMPAAATAGADYVIANFGKGLPKGTTVAITWPEDSNEAGMPVRVALNYQFTPATPLLGKQKLTLRGIAEMRIIR
jgi:Flp pilus assembly protein TadG